MRMLKIFKLNSLILHKPTPHCYFQLFWLFLLTPEDKLDMPLLPSMLLGLFDSQLTLNFLIGTLVLHVEVGSFEW